MKNRKNRGFDYYLSKEILEDYKKKSPELRLKWLYTANILRKEYPPDVVRRHNSLRM
ncbi:MAG: hypothetical protein HY746_06310 [Elusimicrobia bacterium]|nr:hypothetical protein [Elusimicrobiota bacterium]